MNDGSKEPQEQDNYSTSSSEKCNLIRMKRPKGGA